MDLYETLNKYYPIGGKSYDHPMAKVFRIINSKLEIQEAKIKKLEEENKELKDLLSTNPSVAEEGAPASRQSKPISSESVEGQEQKVPVAIWMASGKFDSIVFFDYIKKKYFSDPTLILQKRLLNDVSDYSVKDEIVFGTYSKTFVEIFEVTSQGQKFNTYLKLKSNQFRYLFMMDPENFVGEFQQPSKALNDIIEKFQFLIGVDNGLYIVLKFIFSSSRKTQLYKVSPSDCEANAEFIITELEKWKKENNPA